MALLTDLEVATSASGFWPDTLADWAMIVIAAAAVVTLWVAVAQKGRESNYRRKEQASKVFGLAKHWRYGWKPKEGEEPGGDQYWWSELTGTILNDSAAPVYDIGFHLLNWDWPTTRKIKVGRVVMTLLAQHESDDIGFPQLDEPPEHSREGRQLPLMPPLEIEFTDASGLRWRRYPDGRLEELKKNHRRGIGARLRRSA